MCGLPITVCFLICVFLFFFCLLIYPFPLPPFFFYFSSSLTFRFNTCPSLAKSLHLFLKTVFPTKYSEREKIVSADEKEQGSSSPDLPLELKEKSLLDLLRCEACSKVPSDCVFSTCGHLLCGSCCYNSAVCPVDTCKQKIVYVPKPCLPLRNFIHKHFHDKIEETEESNPTYSPGSVLDESFTYSGSGVTVQTEETSNLIQKAKIDEEHFVHYGVGCDNCGKFPFFFCTFLFEK